MQPYILALLAFASGLVSLFWKEKEKGKKVSLILLAAILIFTLWKEFSATEKAKRADEVSKKEEDTRARLTSELLSPYHRLRNLVFAAFLSEENIGNEISYANSLRFFPIPKHAKLKRNSAFINLSIANYKVDLEVTEIKNEEWLIKSGSYTYSIGPNTYHSEDVLKSATLPLMVVEQIAPFYTFIVDFPISENKNAEKITLPIALNFLKKGTKVGELIFQSSEILSSQQVEAFSSNFNKKVHLVIKSYVTDNNPDDTSNELMMSDENSDYSNEWGRFRPHILFFVNMSLPVIKGTEVRCPLLISDHPQLYFTEFYPF